MPERKKLHRAIDNAFQKLEVQHTISKARVKKLGKEIQNLQRKIRKAIPKKNRSPK